MKAYAVIQTGGKQYRVENGGILSVERLEVKEGDKLDNFPVLAVSDGATLTLGELMRRRLGRKPVVGDRAELGPAQIVVAEMDGDVDKLEVMESQATAAGDNYAASTIRAAKLRAKRNGPQTAPDAPQS